MPNSNAERDCAAATQYACPMPNSNAKGYIASAAEKIYFMIKGLICMPGQHCTMEPATTSQQAVWHSQGLQFWQLMVFTQEDQCKFWHWNKFNAKRMLALRFTHDMYIILTFNAKFQCQSILGIDCASLALKPQCLALKLGDLALSLALKAYVWR